MSEGQRWLGNYVKKSVAVIASHGTRRAEAFEGSGDSPTQPDVPLVPPKFTLLLSCTISYPPPPRRFPYKRTWGLVPTTMPIVNTRMMVAGNGASKDDGEGGNVHLFKTNHYCLIKLSYEY